MKAHSRFSGSITMACILLGVATMSRTGSTQTFTAADYATNSAYADGWQEADNGGFGFTPWSFAGTGGSAVQQRIDNSSPYNHLGQAWTLFNPLGRPLGTDLSEAGRGFTPLQVGQTISTVFINPTNRFFYRGYTIRFVSGGKNTQVGGVERFAVWMFDFNDGHVGNWRSTGGPDNYTTLFDTNTFSAGTRLDFTLTGANNYQLTMTPLDNPGIAYTESGALKNTGPIDWIQFEMYNGASDPTNSGTDFYVSKITITDVQPVAPAIVVPPASRVLYPGRTARFSATTLGTSLSYQWRKNGSNLTNGGNTSGALSSTLVIGNVGAADVADYTLVITNTVGGATSAPPASLTLVQPSGSFSPYETAVLAANPVAHWRLNETSNPSTNPPAYDYTAGLAGRYESAASNGFNGILGPLPSDGFPGFEPNNHALAPTANTDLSWVTVPALNLNTNTVTLTLWLNPNGPQGTPGLLFTRQGSTKAAGIGYATGDQLAYNWNDVDNTWQFQSGLIVPYNQWSFAAAVIEPSQATLYLYNTNGLASAINSVSHDNALWDGTGHIGNDENNVNRTFDGKIDEVAVFNYAFTPAQVLALYNAALSVKMSIQKVGSNIVLTWPKGTLLEATNVSGPWATNNATSPYTNAPTGSTKFYRAIQ